MRKKTYLMTLIPILFFSACRMDYSEDDNRVETTSPRQSKGYTVNWDWEGEFNLPKQDAKGWSVLTPSSDSRLIYVSNDGNDETARTYLPSDGEIGNDPFNPSGNILSYASIDAAMEQMRSGHPDYVLLKRGDTWLHTDASIKMKPGRSVEERAVLAYYGDDDARPVVKTGIVSGVNFSQKKASNTVLMGINFVAHQRNPNSSDFVGFANIDQPKGFYIRMTTTGTWQCGILIEDCWFDWYQQNNIDSSVNDNSSLTDVVVRRTIITNHYGSTARPQGLWGEQASVLLEENVFDHNGWYQQSTTRGRADVSSIGEAGYKTHNTYCHDMFDTIFRDNIFLRPSSIQNKFTSNTPDKIKSWNIQLDNNLYIDGEVGISLGGNADSETSPRWENIHVTNNVLMHIGRSRPTLRELGWGLELLDWKGGSVKGNIFTSWGSTNVYNCFALKSFGHTTDVEYSGNIVYNITSRLPLVQIWGEANQTGASFHANEIQASSVAGLFRSGRILLYKINETGGFHDNWYYSDRDESEWFSGNGEHYMSLDDYRSLSGDTTSVAGARDYADPGRTIETYLSSHGYNRDMDSFVEELTKQSKFNWNTTLTAAKINDYIRAGFNIR